MKANHKITMAALAGLALSALTMIVIGSRRLAQDTVRVRGTIESVDGPTYLIKARDGAQLKVALADKAQIAAVVKASLTDIKQGLFVGVTAIPQADGSLSAVECTFSLRRCVGPEKGTTHGIFGQRAR
jgi:hypothetical protein